MLRKLSLLIHIMITFLPCFLWSETTSSSQIELHPNHRSTKSAIEQVQKVFGKYSIESPGLFSGNHQGLSNYILTTVQPNLLLNKYKRFSGNIQLKAQAFFLETIKALNTFKSSKMTKWKVLLFFIYIETSMETGINNGLHIKQDNAMKSRDMWAPPIY